MKLDTASEVDILTEEQLRELLTEVWSHILGGWEEHPSYNGQPFISLFSTHYSLTTLNIVEEKKSVDIYNVRARISIDTSIASSLLRAWVSKGWIKALDNDLKDYKLVVR